MLQLVLLFVFALVRGLVSEQGLLKALLLERAWDYVKTLQTHIGISNLPTSSVKNAALLGTTQHTTCQIAQHNID